MLALGQLVGECGSERSLALAADAQDGHQATAICQDPGLELGKFFSPSKESGHVWGFAAVNIVGDGSFGNSKRLFIYRSRDGYSDISHIWFIAGKSDEGFLLLWGNFQVLGKKIGQLAGRPTFIPFNLSNRAHGTTGLVGQFLLRQIQLPPALFEPGAKGDIVVQNPSCCRRCDILGSVANNSTR